MLLLYDVCKIGKTKFCIWHVFHGFGKMLIHVDELVFGFGLAFPDSSLCQIFHVFLFDFLIPTCYFCIPFYLVIIGFMATFISSKNLYGL